MLIVIQRNSSEPNATMELDWLAAFSDSFEKTGNTFDKLIIEKATDLHS